jgi:hypothetical protein
MQKSIAMERSGEMWELLRLDDTLVLSLAPAQLTRTGPTDDDRDGGGVVSLQLSRFEQFLLQMPLDYVIQVSPLDALLHYSALEDLKQAESSSSSTSSSSSSSRTLMKVKVLIVSEGDSVRADVASETAEDADTDKDEDGDADTDRSNERVSMKVAIAAMDQPGLLQVLIASFADLRLNVDEAQVKTIGTYALDWFLVSCFGSQVPAGKDKVATGRYYAGIIHSACVDKLQYMLEGRISRPFALNDGDTSVAAVLSPAPSPSPSSLSLSITAPSTTVTEATKTEIKKPSTPAASAALEKPSLSPRKSDPIAIISQPPSSPLKISNKSSNNKKIPSGSNQNNLSAFIYSTSSSGSLVPSSSFPSSLPPATLSISPQQPPPSPDDDVCYITSSSPPVSQSPVISSVSESPPSSQSLEVDKNAILPSHMQIPVHDIDIIQGIFPFLFIFYFLFPNLLL